MKFGCVDLFEEQLANSHQVMKAGIAWLERYVSYNPRFVTRGELLTYLLKDKHTESPWNNRSRAEAILHAAGISGRLPELLSMST